MPDHELLKWLTQLSGSGALLAVLLYFYRKDVRSYTELWQGQAKLSHEQTQAMMALVEKTTAAIVQNTEVVKSLHRRIDRLDILRFVEEPPPQRGGGG